MIKQKESIDAHGSAEPSEQRGFVTGLLKNLQVSVVATIVLTLIVSGLYPAIVWVGCQVLFPHQANGSLIGKDGRPVADEKLAIGSALLGQSFSDAKYFHPRPSAAGSGYDSTASGGSNLGPTSAKLMFGTTKLAAYTVFAADKSHTAVVPVTGRIQATVAEVSKTTISVTTPGAAAATKYVLDPTVADPNTVVSYHGRTIHATTITPGAIVELKLSDKTPPAVTAINVVDQELDGAAASIDAGASKITLSDASGSVINIDPKNTLIVVNGKAGTQLSDITSDMTLHIVANAQMDFDGIADRVIHYCQDNKIDYKSTVPDVAFMDADGLDDEKLITAFNAATTPSITPDSAKPIPADAVTASASGLDPHISPANANLQAQRIADARNVKVEKVKGLIAENTDGPSLGFLGDAGVNVLRLNAALDRSLPAPAPTAAAPAATAPTTAP